MGQPCTFGLREARRDASSVVQYAIHGTGRRRYERRFAGAKVLRYAASHTVFVSSILNIDDEVPCETYGNRARKLRRKENWRQSNGTSTSAAHQVRGVEDEKQRLF